MAEVWPARRFAQFGRKARALPGAYAEQRARAGRAAQVALDFIALAAAIRAATRAPNPTINGLPEPTRRRTDAAQAI